MIDFVHANIEQGLNGWFLFPRPGYAPQQKA